MTGVDVRDRPVLRAHLGGAGAWPWDQVVAGLPDGEDVAALAGSWGDAPVLAQAPTRTLRDDAVLAMLGGLPLAPRPSHSARSGWWIGYIGYQMATRVDAGYRLRPQATPLPHAWAAHYPSVATLGSSGWSLDGVEPTTRDLRSWRAFLDACTRRAPRAACTVGGFRSEVSADTHVEAVRRALDHIAAGDIYQANLCLHLEARCEGSAAALYARAEPLLPTPYRALLAGPWGAIASSSPELFLRHDGERLVSAPIKGTIRRDGDGSTQPSALLASAKDRAENAMIVDLMRNDLGRVAVTGSVQVDRLFEVEAHPGVWHLVSTVSCQPRSGLTILDALGATFPPGSVTGAPKIRAMDVIDDLETTPRAVYTGTIFAIDGTGRLTASVVIRTLEIADGRARLGVGSGIVADSDPGAEYRECLDKARPIVAALGASLVADDGRGYPRAAT